MEIKVLIIDDHHVLIEGLTSLLEREHISIVGTASSHDVAIEKIEKIHTHSKTRTAIRTAKGKCPLFRIKALHAKDHR